MRLLLIEDDQDATLLFEKALRQEGYTVETATDGQTGLNKALADPYDLVILNHHLPVKDGWSICRPLREAGQTPVLLLTASGADENRVKELDLDADDYLEKPFELSELMARVRLLLQRKPAREDSVIRVDTLEIDTQSRTVRRGGEFVRVTAKEYGLLECLARGADTMLSREDISQRVWHEAHNPLSNLIEEYIKRVRKKIKLVGHKPLIHARRGEGYILTAKEFS